MLKLFTALVLPPHLPERLARLRAYNLPGAQWEMRENFHLTLRFIGSVDEGVARDIDAALERVRAPGFTLAVSGTGAFGGEKPRALWAGVSDSEGLRVLQGRVARALDPFCSPDAHGRFIPHITLAHLDGTPPQAVADYLERTSTLSEPVFGVRSFSLFATRQGKHGKWYEPLREYHFAETPRML